MTSADPQQSPDGASRPPLLLCLGLGYTARALGRRLAARGWRIAGSARSPEGMAAISGEGWQSLLLDGDRRSPELARVVMAATHILVSAPPGDGGADPVLQALASELRGAPRLAWIGYLSTVGVYGDHGGRWIDETTAPSNPGARGQLRLEAEAAWLSFAGAHGKRVEVFRLPGIYGPGRGPLAQLLAGRARRIVKPGQVFNRMHVADIAAALEAAIDAPSRHAIYNLVDDEPAPADVVLAYAAELLGREPPPAVSFEQAQLTPMAASFYEQSKRVSNRRMKDALGVRLAYPTYREGLAAIAATLKSGR